MVPSAAPSDWALADAEWAACQPGTGHREMLLHIGGEHAGFRPLNPEEESL